MTASLFLRDDTVIEIEKLGGGWETETVKLKGSDGDIVIFAEPTELDRLIDTLTSYRDSKPAATEAHDG